MSAVVVALLEFEEEEEAAVAAENPLETSTLTCGVEVAPGMPS